MHCERLIKLIKSWYISVKDETMAPARMVSFMEKHVATCPDCLKDPDVQDEVAKISEIIFPEYKTPKPAFPDSSLDDSDDDDDMDVEKESSEDSEEETDEFEEFDEDFDEDPELADDDEI